ncbi:MAG: sulfite oxidase-like oxidoreductase [Thermoleophilaceae bacterium]|jgi:DMSO/TMAO reductase YedYZ molybdopterin-dependent catalytic subunit
MAIVSRGFRGRRRDEGEGERLPPGQYIVRDFPVLSAGPTPHTPLEEWSFTVQGAVEPERTWTWEEIHELPTETVTRDIHCVTRWSKFDTTWEGVSIDTLLDGLDIRGAYVTAYSDGGYTTNLEMESVTGGKAWVVWNFNGEPLEPEHGGPARMIVPHLYFWKSAKWVRGLRVMERDQMGFWEGLGYHNHGDPWREQRYWGD